MTSRCLLAGQSHIEQSADAVEAADRDVKKFDRQATKVGTEFFAALVAATGAIRTSEGALLVDSLSDWSFRDLDGNC